MSSFELLLSPRQIVVRSDRESKALFIAKDKLAYQRFRCVLR